MGRGRRSVRRDPPASRPDAPGYFLDRDRGVGLLSWRTARERLENARNYWVATASPEGRPHAMPVWGVWLAERFLFSTGPSTRKARNLVANPRAVVHLESGAEVVVVEGIAEEVSDEGVIQAFLSAYNPKYGWNFSAADLRSGGLFEVRPTKAFAWLGDEGESFSGTGTRWLFEELPAS